MPQISDFFKVNTTVVGAGPVKKFGLGLLLTTADDIPAGGSKKAARYNSNDAVREATSDVNARAAASVWFQGNPAPQALYLGRWASEFISTRLIGGALPSAPDSGALDVASAAFSYDGVDIIANLTAADTYAAIAAAIQTSLTTGRVASVEITDGGNGYATAPTVVFSDPPSGTTATGTAAVTGSAVTGITITNAGSGYTTAPTITIAAGSGGGARTATATATLDGTTARLAGATFAYDTTRQRFVLTLAGVDDVGAFFGPPSTGTNIAPALGMAQESNPTYLIGHDAETAGDAVTEINGIVADRPFLLMRDAGTPDAVSDADTDTALRAYANAGRMIYLQRSDDDNFAAENTDNPVRQAFNLQQQNVVAIYSESGTYPDVGAGARLSAVDYDGFNTQITLHGRTLPGVLPSDIDDDYALLRAMLGNIYTTIGGDPTFVEGLVSRTGYYADGVYWLLWAQNALEQAAWNAVRNSRRLTRGGLRAALAAVMQQGVANGGLQPGLEVMPATAQDIRQTTGNASFNGVLVNGYLVHVGRVVNRNAPVKIWGAGSEAIHTAGIDLLFLNDLAEPDAETDAA